VVEVEKVVYIEVPVETVREVVREVPTEVIKEVEVIREVPTEVVREVPVYIDREVYTEVRVEVPVEIAVEVEREVPVQLIKEVPVEVVRESTGGGVPTGHDHSGADAGRHETKTYLMSEREQLARAGVPASGAVSGSEMVLRRQGGWADGPSKPRSASAATGMGGPAGGRRPRSAGLGKPDAKAEQYAATKGGFVAGKNVWGGGSTSGSTEKRAERAIAASKAASSDAARS